MRSLDGAIFLSLFTAALYCASTAYTHGFLGSLKLDADVLDSDLHGILYHGMILCIYPIFVGPIALFFLSFGRSFIILEISRIARTNFRIARKISKFLYFFSVRPKRKRNALQQRHFDINISIFCLATLLTAFLCLMAYLENKGRSKANILIANIEAGEFVRVTSKNPEFDGLAHLYCGARNCAALDPADGKIHYFVQNHHVITRPGIQTN